MTDIIQQNQGPVNQNGGATIESANKPAWQQKLESRGILEAALANGWHVSGSGWAYPVRDRAGQPLSAPDGSPITRWKHFNSAATPKYLWDPDKLEKVPGYYFPVGFAPDATGAAVLTCGEVDCLTAVAVGLKNAFSLFGENRIPATLADDLKSFGITTILYFPDLDPAGKKAANNLAARLQGTGIAFECFLLPDYLGPGGDLNRLWQHLIGLGKSGADLCEVLFTLPDYPLDPLQPMLESAPRPVAPLPRESESGLTDAEFEQWKTDLFNAVAVRLGAHGWDRHGWCKPIPCLFNQHEHDTEKPAASLNNESTSFYCFKCGKRANLKETAAAVGIEPADYYPPRVQKLIQERAVKASAPPAPAPEPAKKEKRITTWAQASQKVIDQFEGKVEASEKPPLPMPYRAIASGTGFCRAIPRGKVIAIQSTSGGGKTMFIEGLMDSWLGLGFNGYVWSPEWFETEQVWRALQRRTGFDYTLFNDDLAYMQAVAGGHKPTTAKLTDSQRATMIAATKELAARPGMLYIDGDGSLTELNIQDGLNEAAALAKADKRAIDFAVLDYAQLISGVAADKQHELLARALTKFKVWCIAQGAVGVVTSQMDKGSATKILNDMDGGPTMESMLGVRAAIFNLVLTIVRSPIANGELSPRARIDISKMNVGKRPKATPYLLLIPDRLKWVDESKDAPPDVQELVA